MKVVITGSSNGIGKAIALKFLEENHTVYGIDIAPSTITNKNYTHYICDVTNKDCLPKLDDIEVLINNAGIQNNTENTIDVNLKGLINTTFIYGYQKAIKAIVNIASASASTGSEFPYYAASKGGVLSFTKNTAMEVAKYGATCNSVSPGGVITSSNDHILNDPKKYKAVLDETILNKWASVEEIAELVYFLAVINKSITGQDIIIDNGESIKRTFIW
ncbi:MAG: SDR family oxidoreductase [Bacilli bacterium]|nr:SDR family oxidoreductase [Bacilli bacterium]